MAEHYYIDQVEVTPKEFADWAIRHIQTLTKQLDFAW